MKTVPNINLAHPVDDYSNGNRFARDAGARGAIEFWKNPNGLVNGACLLSCVLTNSAITSVISFGDAAQAWETTTMT